MLQTINRNINIFYFINIYLAYLPFILSFNWGQLHSWNLLNDFLLINMLFFSIYLYLAFHWKEPYENIVCLKLNTFLFHSIIYITDFDIFFFLNTQCIILVQLYNIRIESNNFLFYTYIDSIPIISIWWSIQLRAIERAASNRVILKRSKGFIEVYTTIKALALLSDQFRWKESYRLYFIFRIY